MSAGTPAVYRTTAADAWQDAEIVGRHASGLILREVGKLWPGVFVAPLDRVRLQGRVFEFNEPFSNERKAA